MTESNESVNLAEKITGVALIIGIIIAGLNWWLGGTFWDSLGALFVFVLAAGLFALVAEGLRSGKLGLKGGDVYRDKNPLGFWAFAIFYVVVGFAFFLVSIVLFLEG